MDYPYGQPRKEPMYPASYQAPTPTYPPPGPGYLPPSGYTHPAPAGGAAAIIAGVSRCSAAWRLPCPP
jgi:hypothetical protein